MIVRCCVLRLRFLTVPVPLSRGLSDVNSRMNRGFRVQYSSALGPYEGGLHFVGGMSSDGCKASYIWMKDHH